MGANLMGGVNATVADGHHGIYRMPENPLR